MMIMALLKCRACDNDGNSDGGHYSCFVLTPKHQTHLYTTTLMPTFESVMLSNVSISVYFPKDVCFKSVLLSECLWVKCCDTAVC